MTEYSQEVCNENPKTYAIAGIVHDFNHVLSIIRGYTEMLFSELSQNDAAREKLVQIDKALEEGVSLSRQLLACKRNDVLTPFPMNVNRLLEELHERLVHLLSDRIELDVALGENVGSVMLFPGELQQVVMNLVLNACEAMPNGGCLSIKTTSCSHPSIDDCPQGIGSSKYVSIEVSDTGIGMEPTTRARIFEPFFSTKKEIGGSGLGLANVREILARRRGAIRVETALGRGTTFQVFLPRVVQPRSI